MRNSSVDLRNKTFKTRLMGLDPNEVRRFLDELSEDMERLASEKMALKNSLVERERELKDYREREAAIRNLLLNAQKTIEHMKGNAEKEAQLILAEAEVHAEKIVDAARKRLSQFQDETSELKRLKIQLEGNLRSTLTTYLQILDSGADEPEKSNSGLPQTP